MKKTFQLLILVTCILALSACSEMKQVTNSNQPILPQINQNENIGLEERPEAVGEDYSEPVSDLYPVTKVVDGDTIDVNIDGTIERVRLIGIDTPEIVDPRKPVECFGIEASNKAKEVLTGESVMLERDDSQDNRDKYNRLLRYVFLKNGTNFSNMMIRTGYAYEYTYDAPYKYQQEFKQAQIYARDNKLGLWQDNICQTTTAPAPEPAPAPVATNCVIKGNISSSGEKIYHVPGCSSYNATIITESKGERWFCTDAEALAAGWRKALNCPK